MAINSIVVYFPWGAGGNFVKNILTIDTRYDFFDQSEFRKEYPADFDRYHFLFHYYYKRVTPETWLEREWSIRTKFVTKYYEQGQIQFWDPDWLTVYECHGSIEEIDRIQNTSPLKLYDRTRVDAGEIREMLSPYTLAECQHLFLLPRDINLITDIYQSKNPTLNQINPNGTPEARRKQAFIINRLMTLRLTDLAEELASQGQRVHKYVADELFTDAGNRLIEQMVFDLNVRVPIEYIKPLHTQWLLGTKKVYQEYYNKELS